MKDFTANKAYLSRETLNFLKELNLTPYIPFKSNSVGDAKGSSIWRKMYAQFRLHNNDFMEHYHKRSNVETCFHMIKQRFGANLTTKSFAAQTNEIKVKALCHNILVLIQESYELDIEINFDECVKTAVSVQKQGI